MVCNFLSCDDQVTQATDREYRLERERQGSLNCNSCIYNVQLHTLCKSSANILLIKTPWHFLIIPNGPPRAAPRILWRLCGCHLELSLTVSPSPLPLPSWHLLNPGWSLFHPIILRASGKYIITHLQLSLASYTQQLLWSNQSQLAAERLAGSTTTNKFIYKGSKFLSQTPSGFFFS